MLDYETQLIACMNTESYIQHNIQDLMNNPVNPKAHYIKNIYYQYIFLASDDKNGGNLIPVIFLEKDNKYVALIFFSPITGWDWIVQENYRGQHILSKFLKNNFDELRLKMLEELKKAGIQLHPKFQGDLSKLFIQILDNPDEDLLNKRIHLAELTKLKIWNLKEIEIYRKHWDSMKTLEELKKLKIINFKE